MIPVANPSQSDAKQERLLTSVFSETLLGFLFAQTFKTALDKGFALEIGHETWPELCARFHATPGEHVLKAAQLLAFLLTLCRFYAGTHRFHKEAEGRDSSLRASVQDSAWMMFLFVSFYLAAMLVDTNGLFLITVAVVHLIDAIWFTVSRKYAHANYVKKAISLYILWDVLTVVLAVGGGAAFLKWHFDPIYFKGITAAILISMFACDVCGPGCDWYFKPQAWRLKHG